MRKMAEILLHEALLIIKREAQSKKGESLFQELREDDNEDGSNESEN